MIAYFDCIGGASGDMILGAVVDAGLDARRLQEKLWAAGLKGFRLEPSRVRRGVISACQVQVVEEPAAGWGPEGRRLEQLLADVASLDLPEAVKGRAGAVFTRLARAEARVHGTSPGKAELHEVGSRDCLIDVVGSLVGLGLLGAEEVWVSPLPLGSGTVECRHGLLPVPAPAALELLRGAPVEGGEGHGERVTPTGAAILTTLARGYGPLPAMVVEAIGYGAGSRQDREGPPNVLRLVLGRAPEEGAGDRSPGTVSVLEANVDDMSPQLFEPAAEELFRRGALDVYLVPLVMKKGRPGILIGVLCAPDRADELAECLLTHTTSLGVRMHSCRRRVAEREVIEVPVGDGTVRVKVGRLQGRMVTLMPEYEDCRRAARQMGVSFKEVHEETRARAWEQLRGGESTPKQG